MMQVPGQSSGSSQREWDDSAAEVVASMPPARRSLAEHPSQPDATQSGFDDAAEEILSERKQQSEFLLSIHGALAANPDEMAKAQGLSIRTGIPTDALVHDYHQADQDARMQEISKVWDTNPRLAHWLTKPENSQIASDDIDRLRQTDNDFQRLAANHFLDPDATKPSIRQAPEPALWERISDAWSRGEARAEKFDELRHIPDNEKALLATSAALAAKQRKIDWYAASEASQRGNLARSNATTIGEYVQAVVDHPGAYAEMAVESVGMQWKPWLASLPAGMHGFAARFLSQLLTSGYTEYFATIDETLTKKGVDQRDPLAVHAALTNPEWMQEAKDRAALRGGIVGSFDGLTFGLAGKILAGAKGTASSVVPRLLGETGVQMAGGGAGEAAATAAVGDPFNLGNVLDEMLLEGVTGAVEIPMGAAQTMQVERAKASKMSSADLKAGVVGDLAKAVEASKVRERSPERMDQWLNQAAKENPHIYIDAKALTDAGLAEQAAAVSPAVAEQLAAGGEMTIPTTEYLTKIAPLDTKGALLDDIRLPGEEYTRREASEAQASEALVKQFTLTAEEGIKSKAFTDSANEVARLMESQLAATGIYTKDEARTNAQLVSAFASTQATDLQILPMEWYQRYSYGVEPAGPQTANMALFNQEGQVRTESHPFLTWFRQSMLKDEQGEAQRLYHGTADEVTEFDLEHPNRKDSGWLGDGVYLTDSPKLASLYATQKRRTGTAGPNVMPLYARLENPYYATAEDRERVRAGGKPAALAFKQDLMSKGYDGVIYQAFPDAREIVVYDTNAVKSIFNDGTWSDETSLLLRQASRGGFDPRRLTTILSQKADLSTFLHETGHFFLTVYADQAARPDATPQMRADMQTILDWFGVKDLPTWNAMTLEEQRRYHEQWAYNYEVYLFEGVAPSLSLKAIFAKFTAWLTKAYRSIRDDLNAAYRAEHGTDLPVLTGEVKQVMDRMLASRDQIESAEQVHQMLPIFQTQAESRMPDDQWAAYQFLGAEATDVASATLARANLLQMKWLSRAKSKILKSMQAKTAVIRDEIRGEVARDVEQTPVYRAVAYLRHGLAVDQQGQRVKTTETHKFQTSAIKSLIPALPAGAIKQMGYGQYGMLAEDGLHPDLIAPIFGFSSGDQLVRAIVSARPIEDEIDAQTDARMQRDHGELLSPASIEREVQAALHNEARAQFVAVELRYLAKVGTPTRMLIEAAKAAAVAQLERTPLGQIVPHNFRAAESRAARRAAAASTAGDPVTASVEKHRQLFYNQLTVEAIKAQREWGHAVKGFSSAFNRDVSVSKSRDMDLVNAVRFVLGQYSLGPATTNPDLFMGQLKAYAPDLYAMMEPVFESAIRGRKDYRELTLVEFRQMRETVDALWYRAKRDKEILVAGQLMQVDEAAAQLLNRLEEIGVPAEIPGERRAVTGRQQAWMGMEQIGALLKTMEHWVDRMDGAAGPGAFTAYLWRPIREALDRYRADRNKYVKQYVEMITALKLPSGSIEAPELGYTFGAGNGGVGKQELLGALFHIGNASNLKKLLVGRQWGSVNDRGELQTGKWDAFLARMFDEGVITKADMDFVQAVWDLNEHLKPMAQQAHREIFGYYFKDVPASQVVTPFGVYRGGYVPAKVDPLLVREVDQKQAMDAAEADFKGSMPSAPHGFVKQRQEEFNKALTLDVRVMAKHLDEVILFSHVQPHVRDMLKILKQREFAETLTRVDHTAITGLILPWLTRAARQITTTASRSTSLDAFFRTVRSRTGVALMFGNLTNAVQQLTGFGPLLAAVQPRYVKTAMADYIRSPQSASEWVSSQSLFMNDRLQNKMLEVQDELNDLVMNPSAIDKMQQWSVRHGYFLQRAFQNVVDIIAWSSAYNQARADAALGTDEASAHREAVSRADAAVRMTQSSINPEDIAAYQVGSPAYRTFIQFTGYFNNLANLNVTEYTKIIRDLGWRGHAGSLVYLYLFGFAAPMLVADAIVRTAGAGWDDDDGDGYLDVVMSWFFGAQARGLAAMVPFGNLATLPFNSVLNNNYNDRRSTSPSASALESGVVGTAKAAKRAFIDDKELTGKNVRDIITLIALYFGGALAIVGRPVGYLIDVERGKIKPTSEADLVRGVVTGKASESSKR